MRIGARIVVRSGAPSAGEIAGTILTRSLDLYDLHQHGGSDGRAGQRAADYLGGAGLEDTVRFAIGALLDSPAVQPDTAGIARRALHVADVAMLLLNVASHPHSL